MIALCAKEVQIAAFKNLFVCVNVKLYYLYKKETKKKNCYTSLSASRYTHIPHLHIVNRECPYFSFRIWGKNFNIILWTFYSKWTRRVRWWTNIYYNAPNTQTRVVVINDAANESVRRWLLARRVYISYTICRMFYAALTSKCTL